MDLQTIVKRARQLSKPFRVTKGNKFRLKAVDPGDALGFKSEDKPRAKEALATGVEALAQLQDMLYAQDRWAVLLIFQAMDAAGKGAGEEIAEGRCDPPLSDSRLKTAGVSPGLKASPAAGRTGEAGSPTGARAQRPGKPGPTCA